MFRGTHEHSTDCFFNDSCIKITKAKVRFYIIQGAYWRTDVYSYAPGVVYDVIFLRMLVRKSALVFMKYMNDKQ